MNNGKSLLRDEHTHRRGPREVATVAAAEDRGPRQDECEFAHPFDQVGQQVVEGHLVAFQTEFSSEAVVFVRPKVRA